MNAVNSVTTSLREQAVPPRAERSVKLSDKQCLEVHALLKTGLSFAEVGRKFGVSPPAISYVLHYRIPRIRQEQAPELDVSGKGYSSFALQEILYAIFYSPRNPQGVPQARGPITTLKDTRLSVRHVAATYEPGSGRGPLQEGPVVERF